MQPSINTLHTAIWIYDIEKARILWANPAALELWNSPSLDELLSRDFKKDQSAAVKQSLLHYQQTFKQGGIIQENWTFSPKGKERQAFCQFSGMTLEDGRTVMLVEATSLSERHSYTQFGSTTMLSTYSIDGDFLSGNPPFIKEFGTEVRNINDLIPSKKQQHKLQQAFKSEESFEDSFLMTTSSGNTWFKVIGNRTNHEMDNQAFLLHQYNIHETKTLEHTLREQAFTDSMTGLLNRRGLMDTLKNYIASERAFNLLYIDLDGFKVINDSLGHKQGDTVLVDVAKRLKDTCLKNDQLCRFGGDEFIIVSEHKDDLHNIVQYQKILDNLSRPYKTELGQNLSLSASIGIAKYPDDSHDIEPIISYADAAMYQAKQFGKKRWVQYRTGMELILKRSSLIAQKLSILSKDEELCLHYQPIIDTSINKIVSFEALLRWHNKELGDVSPQELVQIAESRGFICDIEDWVLNRAIKDLKHLKKIIHSNLSMSVNISGLHLIKSHFTENILQILRKNKLSEKDLTIELTESVLLTDINMAETAIQKLIKNGITLSIDDFGTGYSSLAYLHNIPASIVKVDKAFLDIMETDNNQQSVITLGHIHGLINALKMESLIEGVETHLQSETLKSLGYHLQQGYYHGRPQPLEYYTSKS